MIGLIALAGAAPVNPFNEVDESEQFRLDEQLVTVASRYAQTVRQAPSIVTVLTADQIRDQGFRTVSEALRSLPGFYLWKSPEGRDLAAIRGVISPDNNKLLVLIDGVPFYDGLYTHGTIGDPVPLSVIKQIEVIKGPGSAIYGTNAFTGVVNIVTFDGRSLDGGRARFTTGTGGRFDLSMTAGGEKRIGTLDTESSAFARVFSQDGFQIDRAPDGARNIAGNDPWRGVTLGGRFRIGDLALSVHHQNYQHRFRQASGFDQPSEANAVDLDTFGLQYHNTSLEARYTFDFGSVQLTPFYMTQWHDNPGSFYFLGDLQTEQNDEGGFETSQTEFLVETEKRSQRWVAGLDTEVRPGIDHRLVAGAGLENIQVQSVADVLYVNGGQGAIFNDFAVYDDCGRPTGADQLQLAGFEDQPDEGCGMPALRTLYAYAQYTWTVGPSIELTAGARMDNRFSPSSTSPPDGLGPIPGAAPNDASFFSVSPRAGVLLVPNENVTIKLLYGHAFRAPTVRELLVVSDFDEDDGEFPSTTANYTVSPEDMDTVEAEITADLGDGWQLRVDGNLSVLSSEIDKVEPGLYCNLPGQLTIAGGEAQVRGGIGPVSGDLSYSLSLAQYGGSDTDSNCAFGDNGFDDGTNPYDGRRQYEFPTHMAKARVSIDFSETLHLTSLTELYSARNRSEWFDEREGVRQQADGPAFALVHLVASARELGPRNRFGVQLALRNLLDSRANTGQFRDDANTVNRAGDGPRFEEGYVIEGRSLTAAVEFAF